jgi:hypothetical protein
MFFRLSLNKRGLNKINRIAINPIDCFERKESAAKNPINNSYFIFFLSNNSIYIINETNNNDKKLYS